MSIEGFVLLHPRGHYAIYPYPGVRHDLACGDRLEVDTGREWIIMWVRDGLNGYYLSKGNQRLSIKIYHQITLHLPSLLPHGKQKRYDCEWTRNFPLPLETYESAAPTAGQ